MFRSTYSSPSSSYSSSYTSISQGSSYSSMSSPMDIAPTPFSSRGPDASCAFPSWPRRSTFSDFDQEERATSYLSDEDLLFSTDVEDDVSSQGSASPVHSPLGTAPVANEMELFEMQRERAAYQREVMRVLLAEKEQKRRQQQAAARKQRRSSSSKKSPKTKLNAMTPIAEAE
ncbi:hypothetical protein OQA88_12300 [Cercophora sp. LCS_1]